MIEISYSLTAQEFISNFHNDDEELAAFIVEVEEKWGSMDLTIALYKHCKEIVAKDSPEDL